MISPTRVMNLRVITSRFFNRRRPRPFSIVRFVLAAIMAYSGAQVAVAGCGSTANNPSESGPSETGSIDAWLSIEGDIEYGEYLSGECVTCHLSQNAENGAPSIVGREPADFMMALNAYRTGERTDETMQMMAKKLGTEEIASLAAYFANIEQ